MDIVSICNEKTNIKNQDEKYSMIKYKTQAGNITTNHKLRVNFCPTRAQHSKNSGIGMSYG